MTEQKAIEVIKYASAFNSDNSPLTKALTMAIVALEELKEYKLKEFQCHLAREEGISIGYNKAVDDYVERLKETYKPCKEADNYIYTNVCIRFDEIAEQLKEGCIDGSQRTDT